jgi:hypothetical protein
MSMLLLLLLLLLLMLLLLIVLRPCLLHVCLLLRRVLWLARHRSLVTFLTLLRPYLPKLLVVFWRRMDARPELFFPALCPCVPWAVIMVCTPC